MLGDRVRMQAHAVRSRRVHPQHGHARPPRRPVARDRRRRAGARCRRQGHRASSRPSASARTKSTSSGPPTSPIVTLVPGTGDDVQALKAGIMEIADIFVVNKADREGADRLVSAVEANLSLHAYGAGRLAAADPEDRRDDRRAASPELDAGHPAVPRRTRGASSGRRRRRAASTGCANSSRSASCRISSGTSSRPGEFDAIVDRIAARELDPYTAADGLLTARSPASRRRGLA